MRTNIIRKFLGAYILLIFIAVIILNFFISLRLRDYYELKISRRLSSNAVLIGDILKTDLISTNQEAIQKKIKELAGKLNTRITVIAPAGNVLGDSEKDPQAIGNFGDRPEISRAIESNLGESNRFSDALGFNMKYVAIPVKERDDLIGFIRLALPLTEIESQLRVIYRVVLMGGIVAVGIVLIIGYFISRSITAPITQMKDIAQLIAKGDFSKRANIKTGDELGLLGKSLNKMADELQQKMDSLKQTDQMKTDFVANVSHELKTPLTSIKGFIETLEDGAIDDKANAQRFIGIIKKHTDNLKNIIDDLLILSELELGADRLQKSKFDLKELIEEVCLGFGHASSVKGQVIEKDFNGNDFTLSADKLKVEQLLVNLIDNAIKYTKEGGQIKISLAAQKDNLAFTVADNGAGISEEHLSRIFERFYRVDKARSRQMGGTGLGLAIVKHIVSLHNGDIAIKSRVSEGTKITVSLPRA